MDVLSKVYNESMNIKINRNNQTPLYLQIRAAIKNMIVSQELVEGYKLPSERKLAQELGVHRNTVVQAYGELVSEGYLIASRQAPRGYFVKMPDMASSFTNRFFPLEKMMQYSFTDKEKLFLDIFGASNTSDYISFGGIIMDKNVAPKEGMDEILSGMLKGANEDETDRMKRNICKLLSEENMYVSPRNIQVVSETNQALNYLMTLYLREGDSIICEEPIVPDNASLFRNKGLNLVMAPMESDGIDLKKLEVLLKKHDAKFIYTMPNYHNPTGRVMSLEKRKQLLEIARRYGVPIIEEDSQRDFRYTDNKIPSLYSLDKYKSVVYIDSFTLTFPYGIKTGYIVGPYDLVEMLGRLIVVDETFVSNLGQYMLNEYIERGYFAHHVKKLASHYQSKRDLLCRELENIRTLGITYEIPQGGILCWCTLEESISERQLFQTAEKKGLLLMPGFLFYPHGYQGKGHVRLCFSKCSDDEIVNGVKLLGEAIRESKIQGGKNE